MHTVNGWHPPPRPLWLRVGQKSYAMVGGSEGGASREAADVINPAVIIMSVVSLSFHFRCVILTDRLRFLHNPPTFAP